MALKRDILNAVMDGIGVTSFRWSTRRAGLYCFNFHRVGNDDGSAFHPNMFSCTGSRFAELVSFLQSNFEIIGMDRVVQMVESLELPDKRYGLITFDDGYIDNYTVAFSVLQRLGCSATFFLPTNFIGGSEIPWWDRIAWRVAKLGDGSVLVPGTNRPVVVYRDDLEGSIRRVLQAVKGSPDIPMEEKVVAIEQQVSGQELSYTSEPLFISWKQAREMRRSGMCIGSHTRSHLILSHLDAADQVAELKDSKLLIEERLGEQICSLAYPVGGVDSYTDFTKRAAEACGYKVAFSFTGGVNTNPMVNRYEISRIAVDENMSVHELGRVSAFAAHT